MKSEGEALLDVGGIESPSVLHVAMASAFRFPEYYGQNWDAFDECLSESGLRKIEITGFSALMDTLPGDACLLERCLADYAREAGAEVVIQ